MGEVRLGAMAFGGYSISIVRNMICEALFAVLFATCHKTFQRDKVERIRVCPRRLGGCFWQLRC